MSAVHTCHGCKKQVSEWVTIWDGHFPYHKKCYKKMKNEKTMNGLNHREIDFLLSATEFFSEHNSDGFIKTRRGWKFTEEEMEKLYEKLESLKK